MGLHTRLFVAAVISLGVSLIGIGALLSRHAYISSVLAGLGTTVLLAIPLLVLQRWLESRLQETEAAAERSIGALDERVQLVQDSVKEVGGRLDEMNVRINEQVEEQRAQDLANAVGPAQDILDDPTFESVWRAMQEALKAHAIGGGIFVSLRAAKLTLGFKLAFGNKGDVLSVTAIPDDAGAQHAESGWFRDQSVDEFFVDLDKELRRTLGSGVAPLDPTSVVSTLALTLEFALRRIAALGEPRWKHSHVLELPTDHWLITNRGLEHIGEPPTSYRYEDVLARGVDWHAGKLPEDHPHADEFAYAWTSAHARFSERRGS